MKEGSYFRLFIMSQFYVLVSCYFVLLEYVVGLFALANERAQSTLCEFAAAARVARRWRPTAKLPNPLLARSEVTAWLCGGIRT